MNEPSSLFAQNQTMVAITLTDPNSSVHRQDILVVGDANDAGTTTTSTGKEIGQDQSAPTTRSMAEKVKLSPDSVVDIRDPTLLGMMEYNIPLRFNVATDLSSINGGSGSGSSRLSPTYYNGRNIPGKKKNNMELDEYNLPPLQTPHIPIRKDLLLSQLPEDGPIIQDLATPSLGSETDTSRPPPRIPRPPPFASSRTRRSKSDSSALAQSNERRSIFGHYFDNRRPRTSSFSSSRSTSFLQKGSQNPPVDRSSEDETGYKRSSSCSILETSSSLMQHVPVDYRMFAPPIDHANRSSICRRFLSVDDSSNQLMKDLERKSLPPLPSPLRRFCSSSEVNLTSGRTRSVGSSSSSNNNNNSISTTGLHGVYPLLTPVPILRQSSFHRSSSSFNGAGSDHNKKIDSYTHTFSHSLNLTESFRPSSSTNANKLINESASSHLGNKALDDSFETSSNASSSDDTCTADGNTNDRSHRNSVRFDPRITVTEFEDAAEREWYNEFELERLKRETILLAQEYMLSHPMEAERYNRAKLDPVTNTYRKRALFSLPVLSSTDSCDSDDAFAKLATSTSADGFQELSKAQVKRILIVDPNASILSLFCKSMATMFPTAELVTAQNAEGALKIVKESLVQDHDKNNSMRNGSPSLESDSVSDGAFDIIIVEQSLYPYSPLLSTRKRGGGAGPESQGSSATRPKFATTFKLMNSSANGLPSNSSMPDMNEHSAFALFPPLQKPGSFLQHDLKNSNETQCRKARCGSDLIGSILKMEQQESSSSTKNLPTHVPSNSVSVASPFRWRALLIGVSMQPDRDAKSMQHAGADIIWGKPIPQVGTALRNQLLKALLDKRRNSGSFASS